MIPFFSRNCLAFSLTIILPLTHGREIIVMWRSVRTLLASTLLGGTMLATATAAPLPATQPARAQVQFMLRRLSFSATPEAVTQVQTGGIAAWLATQENWQNIDDSGSELETLPTALVNGQYPDYNIFERVLVQHMILTNRQLQAKLELHWLDHFSVSLSGVGDPAVMYHYDQTVRADALGNFQQLLTDVAMEPAMLIWLDNNYNSGSTPNENFAREVMQLYSTGVYALNSDGSLKIGKKGTPALNYNQPDVEALAKAMTGYGVVFDPNNNNPETRFSVQYYPENHYNGTIKYFGKVQPVPTDGTAIAFVMGQLAHRPSTAPFEVTELLQRFVTETPSPQFISDITAVWKKTENKPDQIAEVMTAIVNDPEFFASYDSMLKQPVELVFDALRAMPGMMQATVNVEPGSSLLWELNELGQELFYPATVFSFYRPGNLSSTVNTSTVLARTSVLANLTNAQQSGSYTDTWIDIPTLLTRVGSDDGNAIGAYLLDALVDGGSPKLQAQIYKFLGHHPDATQISGTIWLLLNAPDFAVN